MPNESKTLTEQRIRKERALASMRELPLKQLEGKLLWADQVEQAWAGAVIRFRNAMLAVPSRWLLYSYIASINSDVMIVDHFR